MEFRVAIQIKDNFLPEKEFKEIQKILLGHDIPWFYNDCVSDINKDDYYFTHMFYREPGILSNGFKIFENFLKKINCNSIMRIKANLYLQTLKPIKHNFHKDYDFKHKGCLLFINDNNGVTTFKESNKKVKSEANRVVFFNPSIEHCSSTCTDQKRRITVNFNYF